MSLFISNLVLGEKIGEGCFGEVFLGQDPVQGEVATKVLKKHPSATAAAWAFQKSKWLEEAQLIKKSQHRNVVPVYHFVESDKDDTVLYVMEYCSGGCLAGAYESGPMLSSEVKRIATDVASGVQAIHDTGLLHRDIKPSNILRSSRGIAKISDFGWVTDRLILGYGSALGYLDHMPPEVHKGDPTSVKSDVWAIGMTLFRLLHGRKWYDVSPAPRHVIGNGGYADVLRWLPHVSKPWRRAIRAMLRDQPEDRLQTCQQVMEALAALPPDHDWSCTVGPDEITWTRTAKKRNLHVHWSRPGVKDNRWTARSSPIGAVGRTHTLAGSDGLVTLIEAQKQLEKYFTQ